MAPDKKRNRSTPQNPFPLAGTEAQQMLSRAIGVMGSEKKRSLRKLAEQMNMSSAMLSHMASGRMPIPIDSVILLASALEISPSNLAVAVLKQRFPDLTSLLNLDAAVQSSPSHRDALAHGLGCDPSDVSDEHWAIIREVVRDKWPRERWLSLGEVPSMRVLRDLRPRGMEVGDESVIRDILTLT